MRAIYLFFLVVPFVVFSQAYHGEKYKPLKPESSVKSGSCIPPSSTTYLEANNVRCMVHTAGNLWQVPGQNFSKYEVPKNSGINALFTSALWLGGTDVNGQLKLAALRYRDGQDYWTGPLTINTANTDYENCEKYDRHFSSRQDEIREFDAWYQQGLTDQQNGTSLQATFFPNYKIPNIIKDWPAHGNTTIGQDYYLAPFYDRDENGIYEWEKGDYPWYDFKKEKICKVDRDVSLYGDQNLWWVINDKGNIHTETGADPIGMEIRCQAFAFATNDEVNSMTFYNYELINRGTQTLYNTYFGSFVDAALGDPYDDFVGCDVNRGLAYVYNGDSYDGDNLGFKGYGEKTAAVGVDFFEGPFQDNDNIDNAFGIGVNEALNGIGYGDGVIDNERFGMRRFLYYVNTGSSLNENQTDPIKATDYYNYLRGFWKDGTPFYYGGNGHLSDPEANTAIQCDFMFPGTTDNLGWGTGGVPQANWTEETAGNEPYDRRFLQSAGPFVLKPGAVNNITVGVVWARASDGGPFESVKVLTTADDKAQALFENCFKVLDSPHAPDLSFQELSNEVILSISNPVNSNNFGEDYAEVDPFIVGDEQTIDKTYRFQGYLIYQLKDDAVSSSELDDITKARLVAQCDIEDEVSRLVNFEYDENLEASIPVEKVDGENKGIRHSFQMKEDQFAQGDRRLINFKRYYYMAISYAYNNYKNYDPDDAGSLDGQKKPFLPSRKAPIGEVKTIEVIPHNPLPEAGGTLHYLEYGSSPEITRIDGIGNGNRAIDLTQSSVDFILANGKMDQPVYQQGKGPLNVKVVDPLNLVSGYFEIKFLYEDIAGIDNNFMGKGTDTAAWIINRYDKKGGILLESVSSEQTINFSNEQIIPEWGISVQITQEEYYFNPGIAGGQYLRYTDPIETTIEFSDSSKPWLSFVQDNDAFFPTNWIMSGDYVATAADTNSSLGNSNPGYYNDEPKRDPEKKYAKLLSGGIAPYSLVRYKSPAVPLDFMPLAYPTGFSFPNTRIRNSISRAPSIDIIITQDKTKWTRCAVIELGSDANLNIGSVEAGKLRASSSVNKDGEALNDNTFGMGWFPGYAIDVETGMRLQMAFGENSFLGGENGSDMIWNPTDRQYNNLGEPLFGGQQPIYVFGYNINGETNPSKICPYYDGTNNWIYDKMVAASYGDVYMNLAWVAYPILTPGQTHLSTDVKIRVRINKEYNDYNASGENQTRPMYSWSMENSFTKTNTTSALVDALDLINVVPNPYYAFSEYENSKVDNRIKITNLPDKCTIKIYNISGKLIKTFKKSNPITFQDWLLTNEAGIPVASGVYLIHVEVPGAGERILKSFICARTPDFYGF
ncbi:MAG: T9SS type A sorting domain-containing protein [Flavobacteriia bacterium]